MKKAEQNLLFTVLFSALLDLIIVAFYFFIRISIMTAQAKFKPVTTMGIDELRTSKFKYETQQISKNFIKLSACQAPCGNLSPLFKTFWRRF